MNSSLFGSSATKFRLPTLIEEENEEVCPLVNNKIYRLNQTKKNFQGISTTSHFVERIN
jgi:hypothetical protein